MGTGAGTQLYWFIGRGSGIVAYILLTLSIFLGIALSRRWHSPNWPRLIVDAAHHWLTTTFYVFVGIHTLMMLLDPFAKFNLADVTIPFYSSYRTLWLSLGIIAAELGLAMGASVFVRRWIGYRTWHILHGLAYPIFAFSLLHAIGTGTDRGTLWAQALYGGSVILILGAIVWRTERSPRLQAAFVVGSLLLAVTVFHFTA